MRCQEQAKFKFVCNSRPLVPIGRLPLHGTHDEPTLCGPHFASNTAPLDKIFQPFSIGTISQMQSLIFTSRHRAKRRRHLCIAGRVGPASRLHCDVGSSSPTRLMPGGIGHAHFCKSHAALRPVMPAPTTATRGIVMSVCQMC